MRPYPREGSPGNWIYAVFARTGFQLSEQQRQRLVELITPHNDAVQDYRCLPGGGPLPPEPYATNTVDEAGQPVTEVGFELFARHMQDVVEVITHHLEGATQGQPPVLISLVVDLPSAARTRAAAAGERQDVGLNNGIS